MTTPENNAPAPSDSLSELLDATANTWSDTDGTAVTVAAITDTDVAAISTTSPQASAETLMKLAVSIINTAVELDPSSAELINAVARN